MSEKTRELQSSRRKGTSAPGYGKPMSDKAKKIVSDKLKKRTFSQDTKEKMKTRKEKVVYQYTLCGELVAEYPSAKQASSVTGTNIGNLCACCRNVVRQANGFFWSYSLINNRQAIVDHLNGSKPFSVLREGKNKPVVRFSHD